MTAAQRGLHSQDEQALAVAVAVARSARRSPGDVWAPGGHRVVSSWSVAGGACVLAVEAAVFAALDAVPASLAAGVGAVALVLLVVAAVRGRAARRTRTLLLQARPEVSPVPWRVPTPRRGDGRHVAGPRDLRDLRTPSAAAPLTLLLPPTPDAGLGTVRAWTRTQSTTEA
ncbi:hypothetical protein SAMN06264364_118109 [Quadrisphaera granulorum]|uniref:Uncharacterized protein n=2 Tax=Quadrisphaera granulorum TaxID=317664 RepID=A0A316A596_9ACTN|nr:hypothetical protein BXY45_118109 [Quadrisphaera granulorum]SZE97555.1 hypothetical protein SAMN06264364_118109 [Quadrisphaera granulorum]